MKEVESGGKAGPIMKTTHPNAMDPKRIRLAIQLAFLAIAILATVNHSYLMKGSGIGWFSSAYLHYVCPVCGVTTLYQFIVSATPWVEKLRSTVAVVLGIMTVSAVILGPVFCGWICPFGTYQDLAARLGRKRLKRRYNRVLPVRADRMLKLLRPASLLAVIAMTAWGGVAFLEKINPYHSLLGLFVGAAAGSGLIILAVITLASLAVQRPWCRYVCPYGALLGFSNLIKPFRIVRSNSTCIHCKKCDMDCPMGLQIENRTEIRQMSCNSCLECTISCPRSSTLLFHANEMEEIHP
jgi:polyferredoxin